MDNSLTDYKKSYLNNYVYNTIVNYAIKDYKKNIKNSQIIKENDIIQFIILKKFLKHKKHTKKGILRNYFSFFKKFQNKREIEQSIRNINDEMEEAVKEFSKLFSKEKIL